MASSSMRLVKLHLRTMVLLAAVAETVFVVLLVAVPHLLNDEINALHQPPHTIELNTNLLTAKRLSSNQV